MMAQQDGTGGPVASGGGLPPGDDLGDLKVKRGGGVVIPIFFILLLLGVGGAAFWYFGLREDPRDTHNNFRREVFGPVHAEYYGAFWKCVLREELKNFSNNQDLMNKIKSNASGGTAKRYAEFIKTEESCLPLMDEAIPAYQELKTNPATPAEYHEILDQMSDGLGRIKSAWTEFADFQSGSENRDKLWKRVETTGKAWVGYQTSTRDRVPEKIAHWQPNALAYVPYIQCVLGDTGYTSFEKSGEDRADARLHDYLEDQCFKNRAAFLDRVQVKCTDHLWAESTPESIGALEDTAKQWRTRDWDFASGVPVIDCVKLYNKNQSKVLIENIAKSWYGFSKTYGEFIELNKANTGDRFTQ